MMAETCCAFRCYQRVSPNSEVSFYNFPFTKPDMLEKWISAMRRPQWRPTLFSRLCSLHFTENDFLPNTPISNGKRQLKPDSVPSKFTYPTDLPVETEPLSLGGRKVSSITVHDANEYISTEITFVPVVNVDHDNPTYKRRRYMGDFPEQITSLDDAIACINMSKERISKKNHQIRLLQQENRRLKKKVIDLRSLVQEIRREKVVAEEEETICSWWT